MRVWLWLPLVLFAAFVGVVAYKLVVPGNTEHPSHLIGRPMPRFALPPAIGDRPGLATADLIGHARLVNVFASWCVPCASEAPILSEFARHGIIVDGIAIRDRPTDLAGFFARHGNPYRAIGGDPESQVQIALGSSGVPETFVVDARGTIRYQHIGEIGLADVPILLAKLNGE